MSTTSKIPTWSISGICTETRELKTKEGSIWMYVIKIMAMGGIYELQTRDDQMFKQFGEGGEYLVSGSFDHFNGKIRFALQNAKAVI